MEILKPVYWVTGLFGEDEPDSTSMLMDSESQDEEEEFQSIPGSPIASNSGASKRTPNGGLPAQSSAASSAQNKHLSEADLD